MRSFYTAIGFLLLNSFLGNAQTILNFTIPQYSLLIVNAGNDTTIKPGAEVRLGASSTASGGSGKYHYSWTPVSGLDSPNVSNPIAIIDSSIIYTLIVTDSLSGCTQMSQITVSTTDLFNLHIFPNPSTGIFYITTDGSFGEPTVYLQVFDMLGRPVYTELIDGNNRLNKTINLLSKMRGLYLFKIYSKKTSLIRKIIIE